MRQFVTAICAAVVFLALGSTADAAELNTPLLYIPAASTDVLYCSAVNVGSKAMETLVLDLVDDSGAVVATTNCNALAVGAGCEVQVAVPDTWARCRVTTSKKKAVRATLEVDDATGNPKIIVPAT